MIKRNHLHVKRRSKYSEKRAAEVIGGRIQPGSGALPVTSMKADAKSENFLLEDKFTDKKSYSLKEDVLRKLLMEAIKNNRRPVLRVTLPLGSFYVLAENEFIEFNSLINEQT